MTRSGMHWPLAAVLMVAVGCTDDDVGPNPDEVPDVFDITVDATDPAAFAYVDLEAGETLAIDASAAATDVTWDLAFRGTTIRANGGASGPGGTGVGLVATPGGLYDFNSGDPVPDALRAATPADSFDLFVEQPSLPSPQLDEVVSVWDDTFYNYDPGTGELWENDTVGFLVRTDDGLGYARVRVTNIDFATRSGNGVESFTLSIEPYVDSAFGEPVTFTSSVAAEGSVCFDLATETIVDCFATDWDLSFGYFGRTTFVYTNGGDVGPGQGASTGPLPWDDVAAFTSPTETPDGTDLTATYEVDRITGLFDESPWFETLDDGDYPNFRIYYIDPNNDGDAYIMQVLGPADATMPTQLRYYAL